MATVSLHWPHSLVCLVYLLQLHLEHFAPLSANRGSESAPSKLLACICRHCMLVSTGLLATDLRNSKWHHTQFLSPLFTLHRVTQLPPPLAERLWWLQKWSHGSVFLCWRLEGGRRLPSGPGWDGNAAGGGEGNEGESSRNAILCRAVRERTRDNIAGENEGIQSWGKATCLPPVPY